MNHADEHGLRIMHSLYVIHANNARLH